MSRDPSGSGYLVAETGISVWYVDLVLPQEYKSEDVKRIQTESELAVMLSTGSYLWMDSLRFSWNFGLPVVEAGMRNAANLSLAGASRCPFSGGVPSDSKPTCVDVDIDFSRDSSLCSNLQSNWNTFDQIV